MSPFPNRLNPSSLDLKSAELATVAALTALGYPREQLKVHIGSALAAGCSRQEITEIILQMALYAGLPAVRNGLEAGAEAFHTRQLE
jgi:4-carboxymuconolactone decarboxylase